MGSFGNGSVLDPEIAAMFWKLELADLAATQFPRKSAIDHFPHADSLTEHRFEGLDWGAAAVEPAIFVRLGWAILQSRHTDNPDVVFGVQDADASVVPFRLQLDWNLSVADALGDVSTTALRLVPHQHETLESIRITSLEAQKACAFQTLLVLQNRRRSSVFRTDLFSPANVRRESFATPLESNPHSVQPYALALDCHVWENGLLLKVSHDSHVVNGGDTSRLASQLVHIIRQLLMQPQSLLGDINLASDRDLKTIWTLNHEVPEPNKECVHNLFSGAVSRQPNRIAIDAWDGELTYRQLDELSTVLASYLSHRGTGIGTVIPLCFEKSMWTAVGLLGVMKAGGASIGMDVDQPVDRLRSIVSEARATTVVCSTAMQLTVAQLGVSNIIAIDAEFFKGFPLASKTIMPELLPGDRVAVVFTSGTSGQPKGACLTHCNLSTAVVEMAKLFNIRAGSRIYDHASYSVDVFWMNHMATLCAGATLCVAAEQELKNELEVSLSKFRVSGTYMTASSAQHVDWSSIPTMQTLVVGGEVVPKLSLPEHIRLLSIYGPAECTIMASCASAKHLANHHRSLGPPVNTNAWIVSANGHQELCGIGEVGELWLEGPLVGAGYLNDEAMTAAYFVEDPDFLLSGTAGFKGRHGRCYRTGDLVRCLSDSTLEFVGRKDLQVKIQGHRVELEEIEYHLRGLTSAEEVSDVAVETVLYEGHESATLAAFVVPVSTVTQSSDLKALVHRLTNDLSAALAAKLPTYMVPSVFLVRRSMPRTTTGKVDRRQLRLDAQAHAAPNNAPGTVTHRPPHEWRRKSSAPELHLRQLWIEVLGTKDAEAITPDANFYQVGGDSMAAMRLVNAAQRDNLTLAMTDVFKNPILCDMAACLERGVNPTANAQHQADSLSRASNLPPEIFPVTPFQKRALQGSKERTPMWTDYHAFDLSKYIGREQAVNICQRLVKHFDILRTVFVQIQNEFYQTMPQALEIPLVVEDVATNLDGTTYSMIQEDHTARLEFGRSFLKMFILVHEDKTRIILRLNYALIDGISLALLTSAIEDLCVGRTLVDSPSFTGHIRHSTIERPESRTYWRELLESATMTFLPRRPGCAAELPVVCAERVITLASKPSATPATVFTAACALALARLDHSHEILFGRTISGRAALPAELQEVVGPCVNFVPVRMRLDLHHLSQHDLIRQVQDQYIAGLEHECIAFEDVCGNCCANGADDSKDFGVLSVWQNSDGFVAKAKEKVVERSYWGMRPQVQRTRTVIWQGTPMAGGQVHVQITAKSEMYGQSAVDSMIDVLCRALHDL